MAFAARGQMPNSSWGYYRGVMAQAGGSGSGMGQANSGSGVLSQGLGSVGSMAGAWEPSVLYLIGLVIAEMIVFHLIGRIIG